MLRYARGFASNSSATSDVVIRVLPAQRALRDGQRAEPQRCVQKHDLRLPAQRQRVPVKNLADRRSPRSRHPAGRKRRADELPKDLDASGGPAPPAFEAMSDEEANRRLMIWGSPEDVALAEEAWAAQEREEDAHLTWVLDTVQPRAVDVASWASESTALSLEGMPPFAAAWTALHMMVPEQHDALDILHVPPMQPRTVVLVHLPEAAATANVLASALRTTPRTTVQLVCADMRDLLSVKRGFAVMQDCETRFTPLLVRRVDLIGSLGTDGEVHLGALLGGPAPPAPARPANYPRQHAANWATHWDAVRNHLVRFYEPVPPKRDGRPAATLSPADFKADAARPLAGTYDATDKSFGTAAVTLLAVSHAYGNTNTYLHARKRVFPDPGNTLPFYNTGRWSTEQWTAHGTVLFNELLFDHALQLDREDEDARLQQVLTGIYGPGFEWHDSLPDSPDSVGSKGPYLAFPWKQDWYNEACRKLLRWQGRASIGQEKFNCVLGEWIESQSAASYLGTAPFPWDVSLDRKRAWITDVDGEQVNLFEKSRSTRKRRAKERACYVDVQHRNGGAGSGPVTGPAAVAAK